MGVTMRLLLLAILVVAIQTTVLVVNHRSLSYEVVVPEEALRGLPMNLGSWTGEEVDLDRRLFIATGAQTTVDRAYRDASGHAIVLHIAAFPDFAHITPHHPELCYPGVGWTATGKENVQLKPDDGPPATAEMITFEHQQQQRIQVLFWYQVGDRTAVDYGGVRQAILKGRWKKTVPPLIKVLLQCPATDGTNDKERLSGIAEQVFAEIKKATCPPASTGAGEQ